MKSTSAVSTTINVQSKINTAFTNYFGSSLLFEIERQKTALHWAKSVDSASEWTKRGSWQGSGYNYSGITHDS